MTGRVWLDVPFEQKGAAKAAGARWDPAARRWYAPGSELPAGLARWAARPEVPQLLPGEDRTFGSGLFVDVVPASCWFTNVRSCVEPADWERLRRMITARAGHRCEACDRGPDRERRRWLEVHERWAYDEATGVQALRRLVCLCSDCHQATHYGLAQLRGREVVAFKHLQWVTGMSVEQTTAHVVEAFELWRRRSARAWKLDLGILEHAGVTVRRPPKGAQRPGLAAEATAAVRRGEIGA